jgi:hypothetical protein
MDDNSLERPNLRHHLVFAWRDQGKLKTGRHLVLSVSKSFNVTILSSKRPCLQVCKYTSARVPKSRAPGDHDKFFMMAPKIWGSLVQNVLHVTLLAP